MLAAPSLQAEATWAATVLGSRPAGRRSRRWSALGDQPQHVGLAPGQAGLARRSGCRPAPAGGPERLADAHEERTEPERLGVLLDGLEALDRSSEIAGAPPGLAGRPAVPDLAPAVVRAPQLRRLLEPFRRRRPVRAGPAPAVLSQAHPET